MMWWLGVEGVWVTDLSLFPSAPFARNRLGDNKIGPAGAASLADALKQNSTVHTIR